MVQDRTLWEKVHDVQTPDKYTVLFNFMSAAQAGDFYKNTQDKEHFAFLKEFADAKQPVVDPLYNLVGQTIMPEHVLSKIPVDKILQSDFARNPIGNGPFKVDHWDRGLRSSSCRTLITLLPTSPCLPQIVVKIIS